MGARSRGSCRGDERSSSARRGLDQVGAEARTEHTSNMKLMSVTPEVSQPEMSALKDVRSLKSSNMSVMAETSQWLMGPYCPMAEAALLLNSWAANLSAARLAKAYAGGGEGGGEGGGGEGGGEGEGAPGGAFVQRRGAWLVAQRPLT